VGKEGGRAPRVGKPGAIGVRPITPSNMEKIECQKIGGKFLFFCHKLGIL
jgi:hypothetical protein